MNLQGYVNIAAAILVLVLVGVWTHHERQVGAQRTLAAVAAEDAKFERQQKAELAQGEKTSTEIGHDIDIALAKPVIPAAVPLPAVFLCPASSGKVRAEPVRAASSPPGKPDAVPADTTEDRPGADIRPGLDKIGDDADALIGGLRLYITEVCKPQAVASADATH